MSELHVTFDGHLHVFAPGATIRVGRSGDNDVVIADPTVSRQHAHVSWQASGWTWQNEGQAPTFLDGQPVRSFVISQPVQVNLGSPQGPALRLQVAGAQQGPVRTQLAATPGAPAAPAMTPPRPAYADAPPQAAYAAAGQPAGPTAQPPQATPWQPAGQPAGSPWPTAAQAAVPPGMPGAIPPGMGQPGAPGHQGYGASPQAVPWGGQLGFGAFFQTLVPVRSWIKDPSWHQGLRLLIIPYALLPLIFLQIFSNAHSLTTPGWAYSIYVAPLWLIAFWYFIRPPRWNRVPEVAIAAGVVVWEWIWLHTVTISINDNLVGAPPLTFPKSFIVGYNEEISKALPVLVAAALLLRLRKTKLDPRTWMVMGTISGLAFGVIEQSLYTPAAIVAVHSAQSIPQADLGALEFAFRVFVDGFQHAVWAGISGFFIGLAINYARRRWLLLLLGISIPAVLHAFNDWTLTIDSTVWVTVIFVQGLSLLLFMGYTLSASSIERSVRANPAFRRDQSMLMERYNLPGA
jgi:RsiW-degrading membrane proteinase PrsW (M82 family)